MKTPDKQIVAMLQVFDTASVLKAFDLYKQGIKDGFKTAINQLKDEGWEPFNKKPKDKEFYFFQDKYWVQTDNARLQDIKKTQNPAKLIPKNKRYTGQKMELKYTDISCPRCKAAMYKQGVCTGCTEGKKGYKIRLICEENPDHEILL